MTNEERDIITQFIERVSGAAPAAGSAPAPALPPIDKDADALIAQLFAKYPDAKFRLTQTAFVQEHAMMEAQKRIQALEAELQQARAQAQSAPADAPKSGGFLSGLFGGAAASRPVAPPQPSPVWNQGAAPPPAQAYGQQAPAYGQQYAPAPPPQYAPAMMQQGGSGFLGSALRTAAGVAGGMVAGNLLMDAFSGHGGGLGASFGGGGGGMMPGAGGGFMPGAESPWASPAAPAGVDPAVDQGGWNTDAAPDPSQQADNSGWTDSAPGNAPDDGGGWSDSGGGGGGDDSSWT